MILKLEDKEFKLVPRTRKVVDLTERLKAKNLHELIFTSVNDGNIKVLAELIKAFAEYEDEKSVFTSINNVYDFIDKWKEENDKNYTDLFKEVAMVCNEMGFMKTKMTEEELISKMDDPLPTINLQELMNNSAQKIIDDIAEEEFKGYKG